MMLSINMNLHHIETKQMAEHSLTQNVIHPVKVNVSNSMLRHGHPCDEAHGAQFLC